MKPLVDLGSTHLRTYTILSVLGEGAFGQVFLVRHRYMGLQAMKVFKPGSWTSEEQALREGFVLSALGHANVIRIFDANRLMTATGELLYLTMEYSQEGTLSRYLFTHPPPEIAIAVHLQKQILAGLAVAHRHEPPILHRDLKPQNILLFDAAPKIADWGLARALDPVLRLTSAAGTMLFMPPEGLLHYEVPASDVYAAGLIFYQILTGQFPFPAVEAEAEADIRLELARTRAQAPAPPSSLRVSVPKALDDICLTALAPNASQRYASATEFLQALQHPAFAAAQA